MTYNSYDPYVKIGYDIALSFFTTWKTSFDLKIRVIYLPFYTDNLKSRSSFYTLEIQ